MGLEPGPECQKDGSSRELKKSVRKAVLETKTSEAITAINLTKTVDT